jgi:archaellum component FlaC
MSREPTDVQAQISQLKAEIAEGQSRNQSATKQVRLLQRESSTWTDAAICRPPESSAELEQLLSDQVRDLTETVGQLNASLAALLGAPDEPARVLRQQVALAEQRERRANDDPKAFSAEVAVAKERRESLSRERYQLEALRLKAVAARRAAVEGFRQARHDLLSVQHQQDEVKRAIDAMADEERDLTAQIQEAEDAIAEIAKQDTRTAQQEEQEELEAEVERLERRSEELSEVTIPALKSELNKVSAEVGHLAKTVAKRYMQLEQLKMELLAEKIEELFPY